MQINVENISMILIKLLKKESQSNQIMLEVYKQYQDNWISIYNQVLKKQSPLFAQLLKWKINKEHIKPNNLQNH